MIMKLVDWRLRFELLHPSALDDLRRDLLEFCEREGIEILTDQDRKFAGLPPRGPLGWTEQELQILELRRQEVMLSPLAPVIMEKKEK